MKKSESNILVVPTFSIPEISHRSYKERCDFKVEFRKQLLKALGYTEKFLFEDNCFLAISETDKFIIVYNREIGRDRVEFLRLSFGKCYYDMQSKIKNIKDYIEKKLND